MYDKECNTACDDREIGCIAEQANIASGLCGAAYQQTPKRLTDRIIRQRREAEMHSEKAERLRELEGLLCANPDVARILELLEEVL